MTHAPRRSVVLKLSGEAFSSPGRTLDPTTFESVARQIHRLVDAGWRVGVVVGGGNIHRGGLPWGAHGLAAPSDDEIGMHATAINALTLARQLQHLDDGVDATVIARPGPVRALFAPWRPAALRRRNRRDVYIVAGGTGVGGVSTDVAAPMLARDLAAELVIVSKFGVDGIYSSDPNRFPHEAVLLKKIAVQEAIDWNLRFMDSAAMRLCQQYQLNVHVVPASDPEAITKVVLSGADIGSVMLPSMPSPTPEPHCETTSDLLHEQVSRLVRPPRGRMPS